MLSHQNFQITHISGIHSKNTTGNRGEQEQTVSLPG